MYAGDDGVVGRIPCEFCGVVVVFMEFAEPLGFHVSSFCTCLWPVSFLTYWNVSLILFVALEAQFVCERGFETLLGFNRELGFLCKM